MKRKRLVYPRFIKLLSVSSSAKCIDCAVFFGRCGKGRLTVACNDACGDFVSKQRP